MRSYIEKDFPIEKLNEIALREANAKKPIYQIHKWWARRLGSIFRMIILATFSPPDITEEELWRRFYQNTDLGGKIILDPFMGGGTTIVEALKLGCKAIGVDIHPVAWFITKKEVEPLDIKKFKEEFKKLEAKVAEKIKSYYKTICPKCGREADVMYVFWVKKIKCLRCEKPVPLFNSFRIASYSDKLHVVFCPSCKEIMEVEDYRKEVVCSNCGERFKSSEGYAKGKNYFCPNCGHKGEILRAIRREGKIPETEMYAIEYYCEACDRERGDGRGYKKADEYDYQLYQKAKEEFEKNKENLLYPKQEIPIGEKTKEPLNYNYRYFYQMFNERQLLCLSILLEEILKIDDENVKEFMILTFSDCINANNTFCVYHKKGRGIEKLFGLHAYYPKNMITENNVWGIKFGNYTFSKTFEKVLRAKEYLLSPYEYKIIGEENEKIIAGYNIKGILTDNFEALNYNTTNNVILKAQTAEDLTFIPSKSVDAIITDPPYYDNVMYSELADFFYVWQRLALKEKYDFYEAEYSPRGREIIKNDVQGKDDSFFIKGLTRVFSECNRVLKDNGLLVFTFHHEKSRAWASTLKAILNAYEEKGPRFIISAIYPVRSEPRSGVHGEGIRYDIIMVCRKCFDEPVRISWEVLKDRIHDRAREVLERLWLSGRELRDEDMFVIVMGKCLELYSQHYPEVYSGGKRVEVEDAVNDIQDIIDSLLKIKDLEELPAALVDDITKIYCGYIVGHEKVLSYDAVHKRLSKGGLDVDEFFREMLLEKQRDKVRIVEPKERIEYINDKIRRGKRLLTIDKIHLLYNVCLEGKPLVKYLADYGGEDVKKVSELIYRKTGDDIYAKIAGIVAKAPRTKIRHTTLEDFTEG